MFLVCFQRDFLNLLFIYFTEKKNDLTQIEKQWVAVAFVGVDKAHTAENNMTVNLCIRCPKFTITKVMGSNKTKQNNNKNSTTAAQTGMYVYDVKLSRSDRHGGKTTQ